MSLAQQQQALLADLFSPVKRVESCEKISTNDINKVADDAFIDLTLGLNARGYLAYRTNGLEMARRALAGAYPVICQLLGDGSFSALAAASPRLSNGITATACPPVSPTLRERQANNAPTPSTNK